MSLYSGKVIAGVSNPDVSTVTPATYSNGAWHQVVFTRTQSSGAIALTTLSINLVQGTDPSGVATTGNQLLRDSASLTNGTCGTFGSYTLVTDGADPISPKSDTVTDQALLQLPVGRPRHPRQLHHVHKPSDQARSDGASRTDADVLRLHQHLLERHSTLLGRRPVTS